MYKSDSWDVTLEAELGQPGASAAAAAVADGTAPGPLPALLGPFAGTAAVGYLGGQQVRHGHNRPRLAEQQTSAAMHVCWHQSASIEPVRALLLDAYRPLPPMLLLMPPM